MSKGVALPSPAIRCASVRRRFVSMASKRRSPTRRASPPTAAMVVWAEGETGIGARLEQRPRHLRCLRHRRRAQQRRLQGRRARRGSASSCAAATCSPPAGCSHRIAASKQRRARTRRAFGPAKATRPSDYRAQKWEEAKREAPDGCPIKGSVRGSRRYYVVPWARGYERVQVSRSRGERWFCSESEAQEAGFKPAEQS